MNDQLLTTKQAAEILGVTPGTMASWRHMLTGPRYVKLSSRLVRYKKDDLDDWITKKALAK